MFQTEQPILVLLCKKSLQPSNLSVRRLENLRSTCQHQEAVCCQLVNVWKLRRSAKVDNSIKYSPTFLLSDTLWLL